MDKLAKADSDKVRCADVLIYLPAVCETCKQEIIDAIWIYGRYAYCKEHAPILTQAQVQRRFSQLDQKEKQEQQT